MKNIFIALIILVSSLAIGQKKNTNEDLILFEKTVALQELLNEDLAKFINITDTINLTKEEKIKQKTATDISEEILTKVINNYDELIKNFPKSKHIFRALNNKGFALLELKKYDKAKEIFLQIVSSEANDKEKGGIGSGIMSEPFANYKNRALNMLANMEIQNKSYEEAIKYLNETKKYPYRHFCGNAYAAEQLYMAEQLSKCYIGLNQNDKALDILLPNIFENGLASNDELIDITIATLLKRNKKEDLKILFENSFKNIITEKEVNKKKSYTYTNYYINFLNRKIKLTSWELFEGLTDLERENVLSKIIKESRFYSLLKN